eukprot:7673626-Alexandrium_andersonii.AAC.1
MFQVVSGSIKSFGQYHERVKHYYARVAMHFGALPFITYPRMASASTQVHGGDGRRRPPRG